MSPPLTTENALPKRKLIVRQKVITSKALVMQKGIPIENYIKPMKTALLNYTLRSLPQKDLSGYFQTANLDLIWNTSWFLRLNHICVQIGRDTCRIYLMVLTQVLLIFPFFQ